MHGTPPSSKAYDIFHADLYCHTEHVGFVDSDTLFATPVTPGDLFDEHGRPMIVAQASKHGKQARGIP